MDKRLFINNYFYLATSEPTLCLIQTSKYNKIPTTVLYSNDETSSK